MTPLEKRILKAAKSIKVLESPGCNEKDCFRCYIAQAKGEIEKKDFKKDKDEERIAIFNAIAYGVGSLGRLTKYDKALISLVKKIESGLVKF